MTLLDFDLAQQKLIDAGARPTESEHVPLNQARGRVLAEDIKASINIPPADNSAMDGYAIRFADYHETARFPVQARVYAGQTPPALEAGKAIRLFTGCLIPEGADTIVIQENCTENDDILQINEPPSLAQHVRKAGEDMAEGTAVLTQGTLIASAQIAILASQGITTVPVFPTIKVGILTTGDELVAPGNALQEGQIYNSNAAMLAALCEQLQTHVAHVVHAPDTLEEIKTAINELTSSCDVVLTVGGVSVGDKDLVKPAIAELGGDMQMWRVRMKPGKPVALATVNNTPIVGLPGNPVSAYAVFTLMVSPLVRTLQGRSVVLPRVLQGMLNSQKNYRDDREEFLRVQASGNDGGLLLSPHALQGSNILSSLAWATGLARLPANEVTSNGAKVAYYDFSIWGY